MPACSKCGKRTWSESKWEGRIVCSDCFRVLLKQQCDAPSAVQTSPVQTSSAQVTNQKATNYNNNKCTKCHYSVGTTIFVEKQSASNSLLNLANAINTFNPYGYPVGLEKEAKEIWSCSKFDFRIDDLNKAKQCTSFITELTYQEKCLKGEMEKNKANVQIILDFSALKEVMTNGGLVMATYKCPNCNGMVKIPETGKVLICEYCGTPIKPVDIFEKIKSLIT